MNEVKTWVNSLLNTEEIGLIDSTNLTSFERHHLRLMAHCLYCFRAIANGASKGPFPSDHECLHWFLAQPELAHERAFVSNLVQQFSTAARQLERIASRFKITPLELTLENLITAALSQKSPS